MSHVTWYRSIEELESATEQRDANDDGRLELGRRDFLKAAGFSLAGFAVASCGRSPVSQAIPYVTAPEEIVPGRAYWMASTCHGCAARCGMLVKCRDGRPIKVEGNPDHPLARGGLCAVGQATVLELYDSLRLTAPMLRGAASDWETTDRLMNERLAGARRVRVVSTTLASPTTERVIGEFLRKFEDGKHVVYDVPSASAILDAHAMTHATRVLPRYRFDQADVIVSIDADFLGTWISPVEFTKQWSKRRPWHAQLEARLSLTGSKADSRVRMHPHETGAVLAYLAGSVTEAPIASPLLGKIRSRMESAPGRSLIISGSHRVEDQILVNGINERLGNYGRTLDVAVPSYQRAGDDRGLAQLVAELEEGSVDALFVVDANPVYDLPDGEPLAKLLGRVPTVVTFATHVDETSRHAHAICPPPHFLESWDDSEPVAGVYAVTQPAVAPLTNTRAVTESFAAWSGAPASAYDLIRATGRASDWDKTLHDGFAAVAPRPAALRAAAGTPIESKELPFVMQPPRYKAGGLTPVLYPSIAMLDGRHAHNAWLHELPDPISKVTWDNYASFSPDTARKLGVRIGDEVVIEGVTLPAFVQPGQHDGVVALALGYGRIGTERFARTGPKWLLRRTHLATGEPVGSRVAQLARHESVNIRKTGLRHELATTQLHNTIDGDRPAPFEKHHTPHEANLWPEKAGGVHQWGLAIDLERCTGCSGCLIGCQSENNVPVVGKDEVLREREMHWIRIDRYYQGEGDELEVIHQPMMCAHCGNAPCETVCPVLATVHSADGLNQQVYNRCVGTRYCANNCPYKVRRFNWFDYPHEDRFANLVLNPDVTVRSRGVMEKCSMCVQRIAEARIGARTSGGALTDGAIRTACEQSCPADAIVFGDLNDPKSRISGLRRDPRHFVVLGELNVKPAVGYLGLVKKT